ncbi:enoyl-CoA hydratase/isomerase family protein [Phyllobacterium lublinensis]|jgi:enoyl-CoA hydratase/carnithine racemase|uniref:enoyl-CoA hydratase/isomerase family protein n=1 Tax=Phyllobacterium lublinensis TaxID=2875708 RepID=UPI001CCA9E1B|nr:enoyl-CoA hydratase/isomerase family protein [Phyllobacterium sp. 2063]MBZ9653635.1 enoyl-CoA hydratase/isomerase family protein [Phyllobacterium sp. 2063]
MKTKPDNKSRSCLHLGLPAGASTFLSTAVILMIPAIALAGQGTAPIAADKPAHSSAQTEERTEIRVDKRTPAYWRVTFDNPPFNIFGPETIPQMEKVISAIEADPDLRIVVFDSAVPGFFLTHYNFTPPLSDSTSLPSGQTGLHPLPDMLVRLSKAPVVSISLIRGRATGVGSELALASDMRFASREKAILSQWEVGAGFVPGGGPMARLPRLMGRGRALEVLLGSDDVDGELAERYGYVNRAFPDDELDTFVDALAKRISGFDRQAIADTKRLVDFASLPSDTEIGAGWNAFITSVQRPVAQANIGKLIEMGLQTNPDIEGRLGHFTGTLAEE